MGRGTCLDNIASHCLSMQYGNNIQDGDHRNDVYDKDSSRAEASIAVAMAPSPTAMLNTWVLDMIRVQVIAMMQDAR